MIAKSRIVKRILVILLSLYCSLSFSQNINQEIKTKNKSNHSYFYEYRGNNVVDIAGGTSVINGDYLNPEFEIYFHIGYKRYIIPYLNINFSYNKFNLAFTDVLNEGFMSFDLNLESTLFPNSSFTPFVFVGGGYNASNYFKQTATKVQGGGGLEYIVSEGFGLKLFTDYNFVFSDTLDNLEKGASNDTYFRIGLGVNFYFGGSHKKEKDLKGLPTIIKSNPIKDKK